MPAIFEYRLQVTADEIDGVGHLNNIEYPRWMQHAAVAHWTAQGWRWPAYHGRGARSVVRAQFCG
ncbi:MAG: acyl-CoA thioesterase, partial [Planctomycetota bacterium]